MRDGAIENLAGGENSGDQDRQSSLSPTTKQNQRTSSMKTRFNGQKNVLAQDDQHSFRPRKYHKPEQSAPTSTSKQKAPTNDRSASKINLK